MSASLICELTGAEDATIVNNNAAAVLLVLNTLALGKDAIVSRGELIEIGGAFRMPEIMARAGASLVEVGTTNRTHRQDYRAALGAETGLILKAHASNYRIEGFTAEVSPRDLATLAHEHGVPLVHDLGSGTLVDLARYGLAHEPTVREAVAQGADSSAFPATSCSGGRRPGFIVGRRDLIAAINSNPMKRALRVDKIRLAALEATLKLYRDPDRLAERLPTLRLLARKPPELEAQAARLGPALGQRIGADFAVERVACKSQIGSGALPLETIASVGSRHSRPREAKSGRALARLADALRALPDAGHRPDRGQRAAARSALSRRRGRPASNLGRAGAAAMRWLERMSRRREPTVGEQMAAALRAPRAGDYARRCNLGAACAQRRGAGAKQYRRLFRRRPRRRAR